ncbi:unnamed protein product [Ascophyllum nodosum]
MGDSGEELSFRALTSVREVVEEDAWRTSRQTLASKQHKLHRGSFHHRSLLEEASLNQRAPPNEGKGVEIRDFVGYGSKPPTPVPQSNNSSFAPAERGETLVRGGRESVPPRTRPSSGDGASGSATDFLHARGGGGGRAAAFVTDTFLASSVVPPSREAAGFAVADDARDGVGVACSLSGARALAHDWLLRPGRGGDHDDVVVTGDTEAKGEEDYEETEVGELRKQLEALSNTLRREFELKLLPMATEGAEALSRRAARVGRLRLEAQLNESAWETRQLEEESSRLRQQIAGLQVANAGLAVRADVLAERLSALRARTSKSSAVARCLSAWRANATRCRKERARNVAAGEHARLKLTTRTFRAWKLETRRAGNLRSKKAADLKLHAVSKEIVERYEAELSATRAALDEANNQIALEKARQREMEEGMRRTLARGMSAMNMEAMQLLTETREAGSELLGYTGPSAGTRVSILTTAAVSRPGSARQRMPEECPRPMAPPRPTVPSSR